MATLTEVQSTIARLRGQSGKAGEAETAAKSAADDLQRQLTELQKRQDMTGDDLATAIATAGKLRTEAQRKAAQAGAVRSELAARIIALESELPALERAERRQRLEGMIADLRPLVTTYADAARAFLAAHGQYAQGYSQVERLADRDPTAPNVGAMPLSESEMAAAMRRAAVGIAAELPERLTQ